MLLLKDSIQNLKNKIHKYMTSVSKKIYIDKLGDIVNRHNNTYHITITMKLVDAKKKIHILTLVIKLMINSEI